MLVIPDTSAFEEDLLLTGLQWRLLLENAAAAKLTIAVPELVLMESVNRFKEKINKHVGNVTTSLETLEKLTRSRLTKPCQPENATRWIRDYRNHLRSKVLERGGAILPIPRVPHIKLVRRDLGRRKPFAETGKGYRDALIWETVLKAVHNQSTDIAFICENTRDFGAVDKKAKSFHPDLIRDLVRLEAENKVHLFDRLKSFIDEILWPALPKPHRSFLDFVREKFPGFSLEKQLERLLLDELPGQEVGPRELGKEIIFENPTITGVGMPINVRVLEEAESEDGERVLELETEVECLFDAYIEKSEYYTMSTRNQPYATEWNEMYMDSDFYATVCVNGYATFDETSGTLTNFEVVDLTGQR